MHARQATCVDLALLAGSGLNRRVGSWAGRDLRASLVRLEGGDALGGHVNRESDVVMLVLEGRGRAHLGGSDHALSPHTLLYVPRGLERVITSDAGQVLHLLVVHRPRAASSSWRWRPRRRRPWEDPWEDDSVPPPPGRGGS